MFAFTPGAAGGDPFLALASDLKGMLPATEQKPQIEIANVLTATPQRLGEYAGTLLTGRDADAVLVLVVDQLEELFTPAAERRRRGFIELLARAADDHRVRVLATLRADFLPQCAVEPDMAVLLQTGAFVLGPPGAATLLDMIRKPAERAGLDLEEDLVGEILKDAGGDPGAALPLVAFCLDELYRRTAPEHRLTLDAYREMGGLRGAIGRRAGELVGRIGGADGTTLESVLPRLFRALVHVDATGKAVRQRASWADLIGMPPPVPQLVKTLTDPGRLLLADGSLTDISGGHATIMLAHEALLQEWPALSEWLAANHAQMQRLQGLLLHLASRVAEDRLYAAAALGRIGPGAAGAVPALAAALRDADAGVRQATAETLGQIGPGAAGAVPALVCALKDSKESVRHNAANALARIEAGPA